MDENALTVNALYTANLNIEMRIGSGNGLLDMAADLVVERILEIPERSNCREGA